MLIIFISVVPLTVPVKNTTTFVIETKQPTQDTSEINGRLQDTRRIESRWRKAYYYLWKDFTTSYTNLCVLKWSFWWALATCGFLQVNLFYLWKGHNTCWGIEHQFLIFSHQWKVSVNCWLGGGQRMVIENNFLLYMKDLSDSQLSIWLLILNIYVCVSCLFAESQLYPVGVAGNYCWEPSRQ